MNRRMILKTVALSSLIFSVGLRHSESAPKSPPPVRFHEIGDRYPIDHSEIFEVEPAFRRVEVSYPTELYPGTIVVDPGAKYLNLVLADQRALRYGVGVGRAGFEWSGEAEVRRKARWPSWNPPKAMVARDPVAAKWANGMPGGPDNPLGARALYLYQGEVDTLYRIHGTNQPASIGKAVSSGCIRLINADIADLYNRVQIGAKVIVLHAKAPHPPLEQAQAAGSGKRREQSQRPSLY